MSITELDQQANWLDREEYPFNPKSFTLPMGKMSYVDEGQGETIVMVHGNPAWSFVYRHLIQSLSSRYRCIAVDHIGFGLSDKPYDWSYLPREHAENLTALLDALAVGNITLVVQDWGGPIGLSYAVNNPGKVKRLVILNTWMWPVNDDWYYQAFSMFTGGVIGRFLSRHFNFFASVIMKSVYGDKSKFPPNIHEQFTNALPTPGSRKGTWVFPHEIIHSGEWLQELWDGRDRIKDKPAMLAWGMKDIAFREKELKRWMDLFPGAPVTRYEDAGHYVQDEKSLELAQSIDEFMQAT